MVIRFDKRIHNLKTQNIAIRKFIDHSDAFIETKLKPVISKAFSERINLAVTQVNGCKVCSYQHARKALKAGMSQEEVDFLLAGGFEDVPKEQLEALLFAQHYAETDGNPDPEIEEKILKIYGKEKTSDIMSNILIIMLSNLRGNTVEAFRFRLKGNGLSNSNFWQEIAVIVNFLRIIPVIIIKLLKHKFFITKRVRIV